MSITFQDIMTIFKEKKAAGQTFYLPIPGYPVKGIPLTMVSCLFDSQLEDTKFVEIFDAICELIDPQEMTANSACLLHELTLRMPFRYDRYLLLKALFGKLT
jgi:hypothetical protein